MHNLAYKKAFKIYSALLRNETLKNKVNENWKEHFPYMLGYSDRPDKDEISYALRKYYLDGKDISMEYLSGASNLFSDISFFLPDQAATILHSKVAPAYPYYYSYEGSFSLGGILLSKTVLPLPTNINYALGSSLSWIFTNVLRTGRNDDFGMIFSKNKSIT